MPCRQTDLRAPLHIWKAPAASLPLSAALPEEPPEKEGVIHFAGFVALMVLMVFVMFNDIQRIIG